MKIGIIREGKVPPDTRVALTPKQCVNIMEQHKVQIVVQPSANRCFSDDEYTAAGIQLAESLNDCDVLLGVKEVPIAQLIPNKTYFFFSHTIKKQAYNRQLLRAMIERNISMMDYEVLKDEAGKRVIAFGRWAGIVGAHNGIWTYGQRTGLFTLPRMTDFHDFAEAKAYYSTKLDLPNLKVVLTGTGRVGNGSAEVLEAMGFSKVKPREFLAESFDKPVFTQLVCKNYVARKSDNGFDKPEFYAHPERYQSIFASYAQVADIMINGIYWDNAAPAFFTKEEMRSADFNVKVIADVTCDIAPVSSIPSTLYATTIDNPVFGYNPMTENAEAPYQAHTIDMMTIDNLPNELPRDASENFGAQFINHVVEELLYQPEGRMMRQANICKNGDLTEAFEYLRDYLGVVNA
jgi:alanine dehydrogenase